jgi:hypothetical protein
LHYAIVSPLIPSANARGAIAAPISLAIGDSLKYDRKTQGAAVWHIRCGSCAFADEVNLLTGGLPARAKIPSAELAASNKQQAYACRRLLAAL